MKCGLVFTKILPAGIKTMPVAIFDLEDIYGYKK